MRQSTVFSSFLLPFLLFYLPVETEDKKSVFDDYSIDKTEASVTVSAPFTCQPNFYHTYNGEVFGFLFDGIVGTYNTDNTDQSVVPTFQDDYVTHK